MQALTFQPGQADSGRLESIPEPGIQDGLLLVEALAVGICGTDRELLAGTYGWAPPGRDRMVIGHESLGRVLRAPAGSGFAEGDRVVGIVRRPDPVPCANCAALEWDMCRNGRYTERGIKELDGYCSERYLLEPGYAVRVDPALGIAGVLLEPASVLAKAWEHVNRIGSRAHWRPRTALVTGAGPVGLLAAMMGVQQGLEVHVLDRADSGPKPQLVRSLGAVYHSGGMAGIGCRPDVVIECTGASELVMDAVNGTAPGSVVCLAGVSSGGRKVDIDVGLLNRSMVLENDVVFGTVNANRRHYEAGAAALHGADPAWLAGLVTRRLPLAGWRQAMERRDGDVKTVIDFTA